MVKILFKRFNIVKFFTKRIWRGPQ